MNGLETETARQMFEAGIARFESGDYLGAQDSFEAALQLAPERPALLNNLAACLIRTGDSKRALDLSRRAAAIAPDNADAWVNIAASLCAEKKFAAAREAAKKAIALNPRDSDAWYHVGYCCFALGEAEDALHAYDKALERDPLLIDAIFGIGTILATLKHRYAALLCFAKCIDIDPAHAASHFSRATLLQDLVRHEAAIAAYQEALRCGHPDESDIHYSLASLGIGETPSRPPASYVKRLFDSYAPNFESHLVQTLKYRIPETINDAFFRFGMRNVRFLDLGCGTGLVGNVVRDRCSRLVGVDLSERMLGIAREKGCYDELHAADLVEYLKVTTQTFDTICATDVLNYLGDLDDVISACFRVLGQGGVFLFTIETPPADQNCDFALRSTMRYTHSQAYCEKLARQSGFSEIEAIPTVLRIESGEPVSALCLALIKK
jgi:predicted TPR repeat methyltransferase